MRFPRAFLVFVSLAACTHARGGPSGAPPTETIASDPSSPARIDVTFVDRLSPSFRLEDVVLLADGALVAERSTGDEPNAPREIPLAFFGVAPGWHRLSLRARYRGHGYGVFSYLNRYVFDVRKELDVYGYGARTLVVKCTAAEHPDVAFEDRPHVDCAPSLR